MAWLWNGFYSPIGEPIDFIKEPIRHDGRCQSLDGSEPDRLLPHWQAIRPDYVELPL